MVYQYKENILITFQRGLHYYGFLNGSERELSRDIVHILDDQLIPGDKIVGFNSGVKRTSFLLDYDYMTYIGSLCPFLLFDVCDSKSENQDFVGEKPLWLLAFAWFEERFRLHMFSNFNTSWDIVPNEIVRYK